MGNVGMAGLRDTDLCECVTWPAQTVTYFELRRSCPPKMHACKRRSAAQAMIPHLDCQCPRQVRALARRRVPGLRRFASPPGIMKDAVEHRPDVRRGSSSNPFEIKARL